MPRELFSWEILFICCHAVSMSSQIDSHTATVYLCYQYFLHLKTNSIITYTIKNCYGCFKVYPSNSTFQIIKHTQYGLIANVYIYVTTNCCNEKLTLYTNCTQSWLGIQQRKISFLNQRQDYPQLDMIIIWSRDNI